MHQYIDNISQGRRHGFESRGGQAKRAIITARGLGERCKLAKWGRGKGPKVFQFYTFKVPDNDERNQEM